jgi:hypothetical protein
MRSLIIVFSFILIVLAGCQRDEIIFDPPFTSTGVYVLNEGSFNQPGTWDYTFIDLGTDSVKTNVYLNSNNGANLAPFPNGIALVFNDLYITSQGNYGGPGKIYKISTANNKPVDTLTFGNNPYNLFYYQNSVYVTNISGSRVSRINTDLDIIAEYEVGPNPKDPMFAVNHLYVTKASYTTEKSLAIINLISNQVDKVFLPGAPVSAANQAGGIYISTYGHKKLYVMDSILSDLITDSLTVDIPDAAMGDIISGDRSLYIVGIPDTSFGGYTGKNLYRYDVALRIIDTSFTIHMTGINDIYGISYDYTTQRIFIANAKGFTSSGEVLIYDRTGKEIKKYTQVGSAPKRFAFKY